MTRLGAQPDDVNRVRELLRDQGEVDRVDIGPLTGLEPRRTADVLAQLEPELAEPVEGRLALTGPVRERAPRKRGLSVENRKHRAELLARQASALPEVQDFRAKYLGGELLDWRDLPGWIEGRANGAPVEHLTFDQRGALVKRERPAVAIAGPDDEWVRYAPSTEELEPLRRLSEFLAERFGWHAARAAAFLLAGVVPITGPRVGTREVIDVGGRRITATVANIDLAEDQELVADALRRRGKRLGLRKRQLTSRQLERLQAVAEVASVHGDGVQGLEAFNQAYPDMRYKTRGGWRRAVTRARDAALFIGPT